MIRLCLLFVFTLMSYNATIAQEQPTPQPDSIAVNTVPVYNFAPPVIFQPRIQFQPLYLQGSTFQPRVYKTPLRNLFFGIGTITHHYSPTPQQ